MGGMVSTDGEGGERFHVYGPVRTVDGLVGGSIGS